MILSWSLFFCLFFINFFISIFCTKIWTGIIKKKNGTIINVLIHASKESETKMTVKHIAIGNEKVKIDQSSILKYMNKRVINVDPIIKAKPMKSLIHHGIWILKCFANGKSFEKKIHNRRLGIATTKKVKIGFTKDLNHEFILLLLFCLVLFFFIF